MYSSMLTPCKFNIRHFHRDGTTLWVRRWDKMGVGQPLDAVALSDGRVAIVGETTEEDDIDLRLYDSAGNRLWAVNVQDACESATGLTLTRASAVSVRPDNRIVAWCDGRIAAEYDDGGELLRVGIEADALTASRSVARRGHSLADGSVAATTGITVSVWYDSADNPVLENPHPVFNEFGDRLSFYGIDVNDVVYDRSSSPAFLYYGVTPVTPGGEAAAVHATRSPLAGNYFISRKTSGGPSTGLFPIIYADLVDGQIQRVDLSLDSAESYSAWNGPPGGFGSGSPGAGRVGIIQRRGQSDGSLMATFALDSLDTLQSAIVDMRVCAGVGDGEVCVVRLGLIQRYAADGTMIWKHRMGTQQQAVAPNSFDGSMTVLYDQPQFRGSNGELNIQEPSAEHEYVAE